MPDFHFMLFDKVVAFDHFKQKIFLIVNIETADLEKAYSEALSTLDDMQALILSECPDLDLENRVGEFKRAFSEEEYCQIVQKAQKYIQDGDIFQVVLSNRLEASFEGDVLSAYRKLRTTNPSPYMFCLNFGNLQLAGASPETLVSLKDGALATFPLAGTCKRGKNAQEDEKLINELLNDEKELSEHDMLVDLGRNDLGKISKFGTVKVENYRQIKKYSHVSHIESKVIGQITEGLGPLDAISATSPAGTLSGAPKKRAMEIIDELEGPNAGKRGPYGGAVGYIDFTGNMDLCIGIRMAVFKDKKVFVQAGAGVVADSIGENEYKECLRKAHGMLEALK
jgi:anthranilate synthase component 1